jgi:hypothetical protein
MALIHYFFMGEIMLFQITAIIAIAFLVVILKRGEVSELTEKWKLLKNGASRKGNYLLILCARQCTLPASQLS